MPIFALAGFIVTDISSALLTMLNLRPSHRGVARGNK